MRRKPPVLRLFRGRATRRTGHNSRTCGNVARFLAGGRSGAAKVLIQGRGGIGEVERGRRLEAGLDVQKIIFCDKGTVILSFDAIVQVFTRLRL